ncbi:zinc ribbon domain-containing protein [Gemmiger formicilis]|nr:zinc ribbon domain-containing protein [Gemmiger formicilis]
MATCTQCGAELKPGTKFCENCGAKYPYRSPPHSPQLCPSPGSAYPGCTAAPAACTDAPAAAGKRRQSLCRRRTCRPTAPDERSESLRGQCARHTAADRRRRTALRQKHTPPASTPPDAPHAVTPPPPGGTGGNPYGNVAPPASPSAPAHQ